MGFPTKNDHFGVWNGGTTIQGNTQVEYHVHTGHLGASHSIDLEHLGIWFFRRDALCKLSSKGGKQWEEDYAWWLNYSEPHLNSCTMVISGESFARMLLKPSVNNWGANYLVPKQLWLRGCLYQHLSHESEQYMEISRSVRSKWLTSASEAATWWWGWFLWWYHSDCDDCDDCGDGGHGGGDDDDDDDDDDDADDADESGEPANALTTSHDHFAPAMLGQSLSTFRSKQMLP